MVLASVLDREAAQGGSVARRSGRSWWALRYTDGRILHEWDPEFGSPNGHMDWPRLVMLGKLRGIQSIRLYCPNGKMAQLGETGDATGRLFQFKTASRSVALLEDCTAVGRNMVAHTIGMITGHNGECVLYSWELMPEPEPPDGAPHVPPRPNYRNPEQPVWALKEQHENWLAAKKAEDAYLSSSAMRDWKEQSRIWSANAGGRLVGPISDNVYCMAYQGAGRLNADALGIMDGEGR